MFLDLFAGSSAPVHNAIRKLLLARMEPVDLLTGSALDVSNDVTYSALCRLCASGSIGACCAAPPCSAYSRTRLAKPGPPPCARRLFHWVCPTSPKQQREPAMTTLLHQRTRHLLSLVAARGGIIFLENPSTSLLWLDPQVMAWVRSVRLPRSERPLPLVPMAWITRKLGCSGVTGRRWQHPCARTCPPTIVPCRGNAPQMEVSSPEQRLVTRPPSPVPLHPSASSCQLRTAIIHCLHGLTCCPLACPDQHIPSRWRMALARAAPPVTFDRKVTTTSRPCAVPGLPAWPTLA